MKQIELQSLSAFKSNFRWLFRRCFMKRFENYRRSNEVKPSNNAWAWDMYKNYYEELTSKRQYGFEKLFLGGLLSSLR